MSLKERIRRHALEEAGFDFVGFASAQDFKEYVKPWAKTIIVLGLEAWDEVFDMVIFRAREGKLDIYYVYEEVMAGKALKLCIYLKSLGFIAEHEPYGLPLKQVALKAGAGCYGKNSMIINPTYGSRLRLTCVITNADIEYDAPFKEDLCGKCDACLRACPLHAIEEPYKVNARRCVNSLAPPSRDVDVDVLEMAPKLLKRPTENAIILCSLCQKVCPYNKRAKNF
jgi:epoxyqueuosine reductase QueG